jgi:hypothetical protein
VVINVPPRIKVTTSAAVRGQLADVSLRGYAKNETVRIRWEYGDGWKLIATVVTSNTGSANLQVTVPTWAEDGFNSVRGDGTIMRQQTNIAFVQGGPFTPLTVTSSSASTSGLSEEDTPPFLPAMLVGAVAVIGFATRHVRGRSRA